MRLLPTVALAVPLFDEEAVVEGVVAELRAALDAAGLRFGLVLVDNGSTDRTWALVDALAAADPRLVALHLRPNQGYGGGILAGLRAAWSLPVDGAPAQVLGWLWGDGQVDPAVIPGLVRACSEGAMLAKVQRVRREDGRRRRALTRVYALTTRGLGIGSRDVNGCPKLLPREALAALDLRSTDWFLDCEVVIGVEDRGGVVSQHPAVMRARRGGQSKVRAGTALQFVANLLRWRFMGGSHGSRPAPPRYYQPLPGGTDAHGTTLPGPAAGSAPRPARLWQWR